MGAIYVSTLIVVQFIPRSSNRLKLAGQDMLGVVDADPTCHRCRRRFRLVRAYSEDPQASYRDVACPSTLPYRYIWNVVSGRSGVRTPGSCIIFSLSLIQSLRSC